MTEWESFRQPSVASFKNGVPRRAAHYQPSVRRKGNFRQSLSFAARIGMLAQFLEHTKLSYHPLFLKLSKAVKSILTKLHSRQNTGSEQTLKSCEKIKLYRHSQEGRSYIDAKSTRKDHACPTKH